ncbi:MAG: preprotein translocase subunit SecA [Bacteroidales bacterium]|nr:preprotein translocase subunit SecA [Bacteroidales bacterium]MDD4684594.1 preprotein translocase subunit SecA [Bacteroidales bacterium]
MANFLASLFGNKSQRDLKELKPILESCLKAYPQIATLTNDELREKTQEFKNKISSAVSKEEDRVTQIRERLDSEFDMPVNEKQSLYTELDELETKIYDTTQEVLNQILPEAFSVVKETAKRFTENEKIEVTANQYDRDLAARKDNVNIVGDKAYFDNTWMAGGNPVTWDMIHYDVQLIGGAVLHQGKIAEMATGEGKTLVATLPLYLNALSGKGVHVVTVNDYLAKRDSEWMGMIFEFHGLRVDCIDKHEPNSEERRHAYEADITYGTNNEFGFDYLRDNMCNNPNEIVQRKHNYAIVDEVDSVLIDDARTPLIISGPTPKGDDQEFDRFKPVIEKLYNVQRALVTQILAEAKKLLQEGRTSEQEREGGILLLRAHHGLPKNKALIKFLSEPGMKSLLLKTENQFMQDQNKEMYKIDDPLYFIIDEKVNSIELTDKGIDYLSTLGEDPKMYLLTDVGSEVAELEKQDLTPSQKAEKKDKILQSYAVQSDRVHTINQLLKAYTLFEIDVEYVVMNNQVKIVDEQTGRIMDGRRYSDGLHQAIEAKENVKVEAATQTYATITLQNYFRMYKKLAGMTGTAETEAGELWNIYKLDVVVIPTNRDITRIDNEDLIYKTKREKFNAVINEIEKLINDNRPVLVGTTSVETSELLGKMLTMRKIPHQVLNAKLHKKEADIVAEAGRAKTVTIATNMAGRGTDIKLKEGVKEAGGLAIIGTERHESRRVDRQLRGRAGRQGDPGSSQFFVSLEDNLMRLFGSDRMSKIMDRLGLKEGEVIQHSMMTKSIERAQRKVEENNFGTRKRLLEYDDVMNNQREVIYSKRKNALFGEKLAIDISNMMYDALEFMINEYHNAGDFEGFKLEFMKLTGMECNITEERAFLNAKKSQLTEQLYEEVYTNYKLRMDKISQQAFPYVKNIYEAKSYRYENIAFPITDGVRMMNAIAPIEKSYNTNGKEIGLSIEKSITLHLIDNAWKEHLRDLDDLKQSVQNASYEQKDPLLIYKLESFGLFEKMISEINREITSFLCRASLPLEEKAVKETQLPQSDNRKLQTGREELKADNPSAPPKIQPVHVEKKVGRNDPCPCGSGKKYKNCHGKAE